jgi:hypothetical protein
MALAVHSLSLLVVDTYDDDDDEKLLYKLLVCSLL